jgi:glycosyltransferase involved in cell wall biosynthesis
MQVENDKGPRLKIFISHPSHFLTDCEPHGDGLLAFQYIQRLAQRGHELHVAVPVMSIQTPMSPNVHLYPIGSLIRASTVNPAPLNRLEYAFRVRSLLRQLRKIHSIDLIHQLNPVVPGMSLFLSGSGLPIILGPLPPHIVEQGSGSHSLRVRMYMNRLRDFILHRQLKDASLILIPTVVSLELVPVPLRYKVRILRYGIDTETFRPTDVLCDSKPIILFLANLVKRKGILDLISAFELLARSNAECVLRIAGSGPDESEVRERAARSVVASRIEVLGNIPRCDVPRILNSSTVYCLPSYGEPFGMTALEAMSCGKPVVGTRTGGLGSLLEGAGSRTVQPGNVLELTAALEEVISSPELCVEMGEANRHRVTEQYSWDVVISQLERYYSLVTG